MTSGSTGVSGGIAGLPEDAGNGRGLAAVAGLLDGSDVTVAGLLALPGIEPFSPDSGTTSESTSPSGATAPSLSASGADCWSQAASPNSAAPSSKAAGVLENGPDVMEFPSEPREAKVVLSLRELTAKKPLDEDKEGHEKQACPQRSPRGTCSPHNQNKRQAKDSD